VALLSVSAACVGLDFSVADTVVFAELPETPDQLRQAEARAHRAGSCSAVNVYIALCKGTREVRAWLRLVQRSERTAALVERGYPGGPFFLSVWFQRICTRNALATSLSSPT
jgi:hypothetical protein